MLTSHLCLYFYSETIFLAAKSYAKMDKNLITALLLEAGDKSIKYVDRYPRWLTRTDMNFFGTGRTEA